MMQDFRLKKDDLKKILEYLLDKSHVQMSAREKEAAIDNVAEDFMSDRRDTIEREELTPKLMDELSLALIATVGRNRVDMTLTKNDVDLIVQFSRPEFKPNPAQKKRYDEIKEQLQKTNEEILELLINTKLLKPKHPVPQPEFKNYVKTRSQDLTDEMLQDNLAFSNLYGLMSPNSPIPVPVIYCWGHSGIAKQGPTFEVSGAFIDKDSRTSDTLKGDPLALNFNTEMRFIEMGDDSSVYDLLLKEGILKRNAPSPRH